MPITIANIAARDLLPGQKDYKNILIATATASSSTNNNEPGNVTDSDEKTKWTSKGMGEELTLTLAQKSIICRIDIEWDPDLSRTGYEEISIGDATKLTERQDGSLFTVVEEPNGLEGNEVKIKCFGNQENDLNGITNVAVYGYDSKDKPKSVAEAAAAPKIDKAKAK